MTGLDENDDPIDYHDIYGIDPEPRLRPNWGCLVATAITLLPWIVFVVWLLS